MDEWLVPHVAGEKRAHNKTHVSDVVKTRLSPRANQSQLNSSCQRYFIQGFE